MNKLTKTLLLLLFLSISFLSVLTISEAKTPSQRQRAEKQGNTISFRKGFLVGNLDIGPICPLEPCDIDMENIYEQYEVGIFQEERLIKKIKINSKGYFKLLLKPGTYTIDLIPNHWSDVCNPGSICATPIGSANVPSRISILPGEKTVFNISVDTGIR